MTEDEALDLALEALDIQAYNSGDEKYTQAVTALREALAEQPAQQALDKMAENARELGLDYAPEQQGCMRCNTPKKCALYGCSPLTWPAEQPVIKQDLTPEQSAQGCDYCNHPLYAGIKCPNCGREQPAQQQEPAALGYMNAGHVHEMQQGRLPYGYVYPKGGSGANVALYTSSPAQRKPLTDEEIAKEVEAELTHYWNGEYIDTTGARDQLTAFARAIEAAHNIKENT